MSQMRQEADMHRTAELVRQMLHGVALPFRYHLASRRPCASRLNVDSNVAAAVAQFQASNTVALGANGGLAVHVAMVHRLGPPDLMTVPA
jgi:hypothetical protein